MYRKMEEESENLTEQVASQAEKRSGARLLMTHPGVGPVTALATDVFWGDPQRLASSKALASCVRMIPREYSSGSAVAFRCIHHWAAALSVGRGWCLRRSPRSRVAMLLSPQISAEGFGESVHGGSTDVRNSTLDHVARSDRLRRVLSSLAEANQCCLCGDG